MPKIKVIQCRSNGSSLRAINDGWTIRQTNRQTSRPTSSYCAPPRWKLITCMQNHCVRHLVSSKLHCALPKCTSVQNYILTLICMFFAKPINTILCVRALVHHLCMFAVHPRTPPNLLFICWWFTWNMHGRIV